MAGHVKQPNPNYAIQPAKHVRRSSQNEAGLKENKIPHSSHLLLSTMANKDYSNPKNAAIYYVYMLRSTSSPDQIYVGFTTNLESRLAAHNSGQSAHTAKYKPWELITYIGFQERSKALYFEKYLKSHSGRAFANKRLW